MNNTYGPIIIFIGLFLSSLNELRAQIAISNGVHSLEISGAVSTYYNHRILKDGELNKRKDRFRLRDAQIQIEGRVRNNIEYEFQVDFADLALGALDPENPGIMDGYILYKGLKAFDIKLGYGKVPYSRTSLVPFIYSPYWQRAEMLRGEIFSRRDVGLSLEKTFFRQLINVMAGVYTGLGEVTLRGDNDASGQPEYIGRVEFAYPSRFRYRDIDTRVSPIPMFVIGANGRYSNKQLPTGTFFPQGSGGEYGIKVLDGERLVYGMDVAFQWKGFSTQFEIHQMRGTPQNPNSALLHGLPVDRTQGYFLMGGYLAQMNYFSKPLRSIFSVRFEEMDLNDLVAGNQQRMSAAFAYQIDGFRSMIKAQYFNILREESIDPLRWNEQFRIGWQCQF
jgi:hypothetical protein